MAKVTIMREKRWEDRTLTCKDCGRSFLFTAGEQKFYAARGFVSQPHRCKECRRGHKYAGQSQKALYPAVCAACGREARVPFLPSADQMVYCGDCYAQIKAERREIELEALPKEGGGRREEA